MRTALAAVLPAPNRDVELREYPLPDLDAGEALLQVAFSEVCGTDVHLHHGRLAGVPYPLIPGHVSAGTLTAVRGDVRDVDGVPLQEGDVVTFLDVHRTCHRCWYCLVAKASTRCPQRKVYGITYGAADGLCGGWADHVHLKADTRVLRLGSASPRAFLAAGCALPTAIHGVERARIGIGDVVLVLGTGPVGLALAALARASGAAAVLAIGGPASRLPAATALGVDAVLDFATASTAEQVEWAGSAAIPRGSHPFVGFVPWRCRLTTVSRAARKAPASTVPSRPAMSVFARSAKTLGCGPIAGRDGCVRAVVAAAPTSSSRRPVRRPPSSRRCAARATPAASSSSVSTPITATSRSTRTPT